MTGQVQVQELGRIDDYPTQLIAGLSVRMGRPMPFGATRVPGGVNFSVYSNRASAMTLVLFRVGEPEPFAELPFPPEFRIGGVFAMTVFGLDVEAIEYGYRAAGPTVPEVGASRSARTCIKVDFPEPLLPTIATLSPSWTSKLTPLKASKRLCLRP